MNRCHRPLGLLTLCAALLLPPAASAAEPATRVAGVTFEPRAQVAGHSVPLNGTGVRAVAWFKGYAAALYLPQRASTVEAVVNQPGAKRLQLRLLVQVPTAEFIKAFDLGVQRNQTPDAQKRLADRVAHFDAQLRQLDKVNKGDTVNLDFLPGQGMQMLLNGKTVGTPIAGEDFYAALLQVFIGARVSDDKLRAGLLGQVSAAQ